MEAHASLLELLADVPVVGIPDRLTSERIWDAEAVRGLIGKFGVHTLVFFPTLFDANDEMNSLRHFHAELSRGRAPPWLEVVLETPEVRVYEVRQDATTGSSFLPAGNPDGRGAQVERSVTLPALPNRASTS